jgi:hypothetical protein
MPAPHGVGALECRANARRDRLLPDIEVTRAPDLFGLRPRFEHLRDGLLGAPDAQHFSPQIKQELERRIYARRRVPERRLV